MPLCFFGKDEIIMYIINTQRSQLVLKICNTSTTKTLLSMVTLTWHACNYKVHKLHQRYIFDDVFEDVPMVEFMYLAFTCMPGKSFCKRLRSLLLYLCYKFQAVINSLVC